MDSVKFMALILTKRSAQLLVLTWSEQSWACQVFAANEYLQLAQFDIKTAFLNGSLEEEIYMDQPQSFENGSQLICKLHKNLYRFKQLPRCWNAKFKEVLLHFGLSESKADPCLFVRTENGRKLLVVLFVDDSLVAASRNQDIEALLQCLEENFKIPR